MVFETMSSNSDEGSQEGSAEAVLETPQTELTEEVVEQEVVSAEDQQEAEESRHQRISELRGELVAGDGSVQERTKRTLSPEERKNLLVFLSWSDQPEVIKRLRNAESHYDEESETYRGFINDVEVTGKYTKPRRGEDRKITPGSFEVVLDGETVLDELYSFRIYSLLENISRRGGSISNNEKKEG